MSVLRTRTFVSTGATMALATVGLVAPAVSASAATVVSPANPVAGQSFQVTADSLTAGTNYRLVLASNATSTTDVSEANSCSTATAAATGGTLTCTLTENTAGTYSLNVLSADGTAVLTSQAVSVAGVVSGVQTPTVSDQLGTSDKVTVYANPGVKSYTIQGKEVTFAQGETSKIVDITPTAGADWTDVTVVANAADGYRFADGTQTQTWNYRTSNTNPTPGAVTVTAPTSSDPVTTANDTITLTNTPGVTWTVGGKAVSFGSGNTVTIKVSDYATYVDGKVSVPVVATATTGAFADGTTTKSYSLDFTNTAAEPTTTRIAGANRYDTAVEIAKRYFPGQRDTVYVASGLTFPDALSSGPAAAQAGAPLLLTARTSVQQNVLDEIRRMKPANIKVIGGTNAVSADVQAKLAAIAPVQRIAGADRYQTAAKVSASRGTTGGVVYLANGLNFPDALSGGSGAARENASLLLTDGTSLTDETIVELRRLQPVRVVIVGGTDVVKASVAVAVGSAVPNVQIARADGTDRFDTSAMIIENVTGKPWANSSTDLPTSVFLATGLNFPDALAGIPAAHVSKAPLALTLPKCLPAPVKAQLDKLPLTETVRLGSGNIVGDFSVRTGVC